MADIERRVATLTVHDHAKLTKSGRKQLSKWLMNRAMELEAEGVDLLGPRFTERLFANKTTYRKGS